MAASLQHLALYLDLVVPGGEENHAENGANHHHGNQADHQPLLVHAQLSRMRLISWSDLCDFSNIVPSK